ncbi:MAG: hypothetical protein GY751_25735 [Bacteroidetes bacterium]|nr:hypothetical protein [Bacteroidota bacterium]
MHHFNLALIILTLTILSSCGNRSGENYGQYNEQGNYHEYQSGDYDPNSDVPEGYQEIQKNTGNRNGSNENYGKSNQEQFSANNQQANSGRSGKAIGVTERNSGIQMWSTRLPSNWDFNYSLDYSNSNEFPVTNWQAQNNKAGVSSRNVRSEVYVYSSNPQMMQLFRDMRKPIAAPQNATTVQSGAITSMMQQKGYKKTGESRSNAHEQRMVKEARSYGLNGLQMTAIKADWEAADGRKAESVLYHVIMPDQTGTTWWYETVITEGKGRGFAAAANEMNTAMLNIEQNPKWVQYTKQVIAQQNAAAQQQFYANQQRLNNNQRNFEATQRAIVGANDAVNQSIMDGYNTQSRASDRSQSQFIDYLRDEQNVYDPNSANTYKVESGYNQYYTNGNGEYIGTNDYNYNPNLDPNMNNQNWSNTTPY